ncbi:MAG: hypothetical protein JO148_09090 [Acidimicrobiia bacterium]|nr:hypothetical protein [Acidimicrobiia bacterium]
MFSDQPATQRVKGRRGSRNGQRSAQAAALSESSSQAASQLVLRGPPPAHVLQQQLALPSGRTRAPGPSSTTPRPAAPASTVADRTYDVRLAQEEGVTFISRARSSAALVALLAAIGTAVALAIGSVLYLAGLALRHTLR